MKKYIYTLFFLLGIVHDASAIETNKTDKQSPSHHYNIRGTYSYQDFKFNASKSSNFNRYQGHTNLYGVGGHDAQLAHGLIAGLSIHQFDTDLQTQTQINQPTVNYTNQTIHNNSLSGHVLKKIHDYFFIDLIGGFGQNQITYTTLIGNHTSNEQIGAGNSRSNGWFSSLNAIYSRPWHNFHWFSSVGFLYNDLVQKRYTLFYIPTGINSLIPQLSNHSSYALENVEINYQLSNSVQPFINGGLLQVLQFSNSRPIIDDVSLASLPEFTINKNGYHAGIGLSLQYKSLRLRLEEQYSQRGSIYHSYQSIVSLSLDMN